MHFEALRGVLQTPAGLLQLLSTTNTVPCRQVGLTRKNGQPTLVRLKTGMTQKKLMVKPKPTFGLSHYEFGGRVGKRAEGVKRFFIGHQPWPPLCTPLRSHAEALNYNSTVGHVTTESCGAKPKHPCMLCDGCLAGKFGG